MRAAAREAENPHAPHLGWSKRLLGPFHVTGTFWFAFAYWAMGWLPEFLTHAVVFSFVLFFFLALRRIRSAIAANLEAVLGPCSFAERERRIHRTMMAFAWCHAERYEYLQGRGGFVVDMEGADRLQALESEAQGFIFVTAHIGHWETSSHLISARLRRHAHVVREEELDKDAQRFMNRILEEAKDEHYTTHFASDDPSLALTLARALKAGDIVALQGDRPRTGGRTVAVSFLGRTLEFPPGPASLARAAGVRLVPVFSLREGRRRYRLFVSPPIEVPEGGGREAAVLEATQALASEIEGAIKRAPYQWFCFRELWPAGETPSAPGHGSPPSGEGGGVL